MLGREAERSKAAVMSVSGASLNATAPEPVGERKEGAWGEDGEAPAGRRNDWQDVRAAC